MSLEKLINQIREHTLVSSVSTDGTNLNWGENNQSSPISEDTSSRVWTPPCLWFKCFDPCDSSRSARELERQIRARVEKMQERRRNPRGTASEQMAAAEQDVEEVGPSLHYSHISSALNSLCCHSEFTVYCCFYSFLFRWGSYRHGCWRGREIEEEILEIVLPSSLETPGPASSTSDR